MVGAVLLVAAIAGCTPTVTVQLTPPDPAVQQWQRDITAMVNRHEERLGALEGEGSDGTTQSR